MTKQKNVPQIRFKGFDGEWVENVVSQISPLQRGFDLPKAHMKKGKYPVVMSNGINGFHSEYRVKGPGVITGRSGTIGNVHFVEKDYWPHNTALWVTDFKGNHPAFIAILFKKIDLTRFGTGSGVPTLNRNDVHDHHVNVPKNKEQIKITSFFQSLDKLLTLHQQQYAKLTNLKKAMLEKMFPRPGADTPEIRFKGFTGKWEEKKLGEVAIIKGRLGWKSLKNNEYLDQGPSMIAGKHIKNGIINWSIVDHIPQWRYDESPEIMLKNGDVIFSKDGSLGNPAVIRDLNCLATINSTMMLVRFFKDVNYDFFYQVLRTRVFEDLIKLKVSGSSIPHLFQADMKDFSFLTPEENEQKLIGTYFQNLDRMIAQHQTRITKLQNIKKACLEKMFV